MTVDPISLKLVEIVLKWGWDKITNRLDKIDFDDPNTKYNLERACQAYIKNYRHSYGKISVLGMPNPAELENIYTNVQIIEGRNLWKYQSVRDQEKIYRNTAKRRFETEDQKKQDGISIANRYQHLMVLGQPGAGKSTFLKRIGLAALQGRESLSQRHINTNLPRLKLVRESGQNLISEQNNPQAEDLYSHEVMPVLVELKRCDSYQIDLIGKIESELEKCGFESANILTKTLLSAGGMLILLDGLDEIPSQQLDGAITQIQDFVNKYSLNRFIISCRTAAYQGGFNNIVNVEIADFDDEQIKQFISNWFCQEYDLDISVAKDCWQLLNANDYKATKELAYTPLLLTFLCLVYDESQVFPKNRAALYKDALDILLRRWAAEKRIQRDPIYKDLTIQLEEMLLAKIAYEQFCKDRLFFNKKDIILKICEYITDNLNAPKHLDGEKILRAIQVQQGILIERSSSILSFSHLTLQEYLTAQYIVDRHLIDELVAESLTDSRWREVFLLVAGLMRDGGDVLLLKMAMAARHLLDTQRLRALVCWVEESTKIAGGRIDSLAQRNLAALTAYACTSFYVSSCTNSLNSVSTSAIDNSRAYAKNTAEFGYAITYINSIANIYANNYGHASSRTNTVSLENAVKFIDSISKLRVFCNLDYLYAKEQINSLRSEMPMTHELLKVHQRFSQKLLVFLCQSLAIDLSWLDLSILEIEALGKYLAVNLLIMQCKEASVYVSSKGWAEVEELMFRVIQPDY
jgi:NACHT domain